MEVTNIKKRMVGGADDKINRTLSKDQEKSSQGAAVPSAADDVNQTRDATSSPNSIRGEIGSEARLSGGNFQGRDISVKRRKSAISDGQICFCPSILHPKKSATENKFDEMIEYALKNVNEADKGLENLGDNFEHDLRLMFMDIMGRVQHWVSVVQNRIHAARADIESLKKESVARVSELTAKDLEIVELRRRLNEAETKLALQAAQEKERLSRITPEIGTDYTGQKSLEQGQEKVCVSVQTIRNTKNAVTSSVNTVCHQSEKDSKNAEREAELKAELVQLREDNERMTKEREEYEKAIQCALLKGISSLNLEAFKVLRCPPIPPCCTPCTLSTQNSGLGSSSCSPACTTPKPVRRRLSVVPKDENNDDDDDDDDDDEIRRRNSEETKTCFSCSANEGGKKPVENSVILLLHHGDAAVGNFQCIRPCTVQPLQRRPIMSGTQRSMDNKKVNVCVDGKCRKVVAGIKTPRIPKSPTMSRPGSRDFFLRNKDDTASENVPMKKNDALTTAGKRSCNVCSNKTNRK